MDEQDLWDCVGVVVIALLLAVVVWLLVSPSPGQGGDDRARASGRQVSGPSLPTGSHERSVPAHRRLLDQQHRCLDATAARGVAGCMVVSLEPAGSPRPSDRPARRSTRAVAV